MDAAQFIRDYLGARPTAPTQLGADALANYGMADGQRVTANLAGQSGWLAQNLQNDQVGSILRLVEGYDAVRNPYTRAATDATSLGLGQAVLTSGLADRFGGMSGIMTDRAWQDYTAGPNALENQIFAAGQGAMGARADQIGMPSFVRQLNPATAQAALAGFVSGPSAAATQAAQSSFIGGPSAASAQRVGEISRGATDVGSGALGQALLADAAPRLRSAGRLTPQEERDVAQSTRASFAARGMATSAPAAMAEALNRDRFSRQRMTEDRAYAQSVQGDDIGRQQMNAQRQLAALQGNQQVGTQMSLADQSAINEMRRLGYTGSIDQQQFNAANRQAANLANQSAINEMRRLGYTGSIDQQQFNAGNQQATNLANQSAANQIGMANQQRDQFMSNLGVDVQRANQAANMNQLAQNRGFMTDAANAFNTNQLNRMGQAGNLLGLGGTFLQNAGALRGQAGEMNFAGADSMMRIDPFARSVSPGLNMGQFAAGTSTDAVGQNFANMLDLGANTYGFNTNMNMDLYNSWLNNATAAQTGAQAANSQRDAANISAAATRAARPRWYETALGAVGNIFGGSNNNPFGWSDKRLKTDIKPIGKAGSVLGLTAYEFRYKGDKKKRKGFMAQDVQKVLPEAVKEFNHNGKKRLAINPKVIGAALAEELAANAKAA